MHTSTVLAVGLAMVPTLIAAMPATTTVPSTSTTTAPTTTSTSSCACPTASPDPSTTATVCGVDATVGTEGVVPVNTGGTGPETFVDSVSQCANLCYTEYGSVCNSFSVEPLPDGYVCNLFSYTISALDLSDTSSPPTFYDRACFEPTCPSTCPPSVATTVSGFSTCDCAAIATLEPYPEPSVTCGVDGTVAPSATPYATSISPYGPTDGYDTYDNYGASIRYCGRVCLLDDECDSFEFTPDTEAEAVTYSCLLYPEGVNATGFTETNVDQAFYDKDCFDFECNSGLDGC